MGQIWGERTRSGTKDGMKGNEGNEMEQRKAINLLLFAGIEPTGTMFQTINNKRKKAKLVVYRMCIVLYILLIKTKQISKKKPPDCATATSQIIGSHLADQSSP